MGTVYLSHLTMKAVLLLSVLASALAAPETRFLCSECVDEMHNLGFIVGAVHVCQTMGVCDAMRSGRYTCEECVEGLEWVEAYIEDPVMIAEYVIYLEQNFCQDGWEGCKEHVVQDFPTMHNMAMEKFFIPTEICNQQEVCGPPPSDEAPTI